MTRLAATQAMGSCSESTIKDSGCVFKFMILSNNKGMLHAKRKNVVIYGESASRKNASTAGQFFALRDVQLKVLYITN